MTRKRHVDYIPEYAANLTPVIPHDATLSPSSSIDPASRGKVPGRKKADGTWVGGWKDLGDADLERARIWDAMGAGIGFRFGRGESPTVNLFDVDLTVREDAERVLAITIDIFGKKLAVRRVDDPEHVKLAICVRVEGKPPVSRDVELLQSDGSRGVVQFLGFGKYATIHGTHNRRLRPYVWARDPADFPLTVISPVELQAFWDRLAAEFRTAPVDRLYAGQTSIEPEQCTAEELQALLNLIPNDNWFAVYDRFIMMGAAIYGASGGADWGRVMWLAWCAQVDQEQEEKPETFWDTMFKSRSGAGRLRFWASERAPYEMAARAFADPPIEAVEPELVEEADKDALLAKAFLEGWCLVDGADFYRLSHPRQPVSSAAFGNIQAVNEKAIRRALGGEKRTSLARIFARNSSNLLDGVVHEPGQPRIVTQNGQRFLNLWSPPPRPHRGLPVDPTVVEFYRDLVEFVLGSAEETELWFDWHAWMLQNPDKAPGWQWVVQAEPGLGKDLILLPIGFAHGSDYTPITPRDFASTYNDYAEKHLVSTSEMKMKSADDGPYLMLKAIASGGPTVSVRVQYRQRYLAANVAGFVIFSNEEHPLKIDHNDRRLHVVSNFNTEKRAPEYYIRARRLLTEHWAMLGEHLRARSLSDAVRNLMTGNAPASDAKTEMAEQVAENALRDIIGEIESDKPPPGYLPVATTGDIVKWLKALELRPQDMPGRLELPSLIYRLGARPLNPNRKNPKRAEPIDGSRLWRIARTWTDQKGVAWDIGAATPARLARLYSDRSMPPVTKADFTVVEDGDEV